MRKQVKITKQICAWCKRIIKPGTDENVSHGICPKCAEVEKIKIAEMKRKNNNYDK